jgi:hypothetical protein
MPDLKIMVEIHKNCGNVWRIFFSTTKFLKKPFGLDNKIRRAFLISLTPNLPIDIIPQIKFKKIVIKNSGYHSKKCT